MSATAAAIYATLMILGVHWGWQPVAGGGIEYIIRIDPHSVQSMTAGRDVFSDLPPTLPEIRSYRITVSDKPVPHEGEPPPKSQSISAARPPSEPTPQPKLPAPEQQAANSASSRLFPSPSSLTGQQQSAATAQDASVRRAVANEPAAAVNAPATADSKHSSQPSPATPETTPPSRPWGVLAGVSIGLFASLAANAWLVWMAVGFRAKYLAQLARLKPAG